MLNYRVGKVKNKQHEPVELKYFEDENEANKYAENTSLYDDDHFYTVEIKIDEDEYETTKGFKNGKLAVIF